MTIHSGAIEVTLDGKSIQLPAERRSLRAIRSYLETLALERQRIIYVLNVDGLSERAFGFQTGFHCIEAQSIGLADVPIQLLATALEQTENARELVARAVALVLINDGAVSRELWWDLAQKLKEPLLTLSLLPEDISGAADDATSQMQLRKWQLQQLAQIIHDVDEACSFADMIMLSNALENRALPWLNGLRDLIGLWHRTVCAGMRLKANAS